MFKSDMHMVYPGGRGNYTFTWSPNLKAGAAFYMPFARMKDMRLSCFTWGMFIKRKWIFLLTVAIDVPIVNKVFAFHRNPF